MTGDMTLESRAATRWSSRKLTRRSLSALYEAMDGDPSVVAAEPTDGGVMVRFEDGSNGVFPAALLYANLPQALSMQAAESDEAMSKLLKK
jgi:hypothetical protein